MDETNKAEFDTELDGVRAVKTVNYITAAVLLALLILVISYFSIYFRYSAEESVAHGNQVQTELKELLSAVKDMETGQRGFLITSDSAYLSSYLNGKEELEVKSDVLRNMDFLLEQEDVRINDIFQVSKEKLEEMDLTIDLVKEGYKDSAQVILNSDHGLQLMNQMREKVGEVINNQKLKMERERNRAEVWETIAIMSTILSLALLLYLIYRITRKVKPMVSSLVYTQDQLAATVKQLELKNSQLENFAYIASHDLKEPLRTVNSFVDLLVTESNDQEYDNLPEYQSFIKNATKRMGKLIDGLLSYSRIGRSGNKELVDMNKMMKEIRSNLLLRIEESKTKLVISDMPVIRGYKQELFNLFQNLIQNAMKFQKEGATPVIEVSAQVKPKFYLFSVKDNGIGIPENKREEIFNFLTKLHRQDIYSGQGIGLAFAHKVVSIHGGTIWVESEEGQGSTFFIKLPRRKK